VKAREHEIRRAAVTPEPLDSDAIHHDIAAAFAECDSFDVGWSDLGRRLVKAMAAMEAHLLVAACMDEKRSSSSLSPRILIVEDTPGAIATFHVRAKPFRASIPSSTPSGKKVSKASWADPPKGSVLIPNSKPATRPMRQ
jgi:hypothetical protein